MRATARSLTLVPLGLNLSIETKSKAEADIALANAVEAFLAVFQKRVVTNPNTVILKEGALFDCLFVVLTGVRACSAPKLNGCLRRRSTSGQRR